MIILCSDCKNVIHDGENQLREYSHRFKSYADKPHEVEFVCAECVGAVLDEFHSYKEAKKYIIDRFKEVKEKLS